MKNRLKKLMAIIMAVIMISTCAVTAFAAKITKAEAKEIALNDAGFSANEVIMERAEVDYERGEKFFEIEFYVVEGDGWYTEYDYVIKAADGSIVYSMAEKDFDDDFKPVPPVQDNANDIGVEKAKELALAAFGLNAGDVKLVKAKRDYDDGRLVYEIEYREGYEKEYSCEVDAETGNVYDKDVDINRTGFARMEYFFECIGNIFYR